MSLNSSSTVNSSLNSVREDCSNSDLSSVIIIIYGITRAVLLCPLSILVLRVGLQRWRKKRSFATECHSDIFTYHAISLEVIRALGLILNCLHQLTKIPKLLTAGLCLYTMTWFGENIFHVLTCVERYLAVVHPITYMSLKNIRGSRIRNVLIGCVWLLSFFFAMASVCHLTSLLLIVNLSMQVVSLVSVSFCTLSVLCVLKGGHCRERADQTKQRAFFTITAIWGGLFLWLSGFLLSYSLHVSSLLGPEVTCVIIASALWFNLSSFLLPPLLYLQRAGRLPICCHKSGQ